MTILQIYVAPHPVLKKKTEEVTEVTNDIRKIMDNMLETMYINNGVGLAAPQVGISQKIIVIDAQQNKGENLSPEERRGNPMFFINPEIIWESEDSRVYNEGCLSLPGQYADITRADRVKVNFIDYDGMPQEIEIDDFLATVIQHEIDHLNGILFVDHLSKVKKDIVLRKLKKFVKEYEEDMAESHIIL